MSDILANRRPYVLQMLGNRADIATQTANGGPSRIDNWIWQSFLNIGMSYSFPESEDTQPGQWTSGMDALDYPDQARAIKNLSFYYVNGVGLQIKWKDIAYIRKYPQAAPPGNPRNVGPPAIVCDYGRQIFVRPLCDNQTYNYFMDFWTKPQQLIGQDAPGYTSLGTADIGATVIAVPDDWLEVIDMGAALRGHVSLIERDKAAELQQLLFGIQIPTSGKVVPGLIATMWTRRQAQAPYMDYGMQPSQAKRSYTNTAG